MAEACRAAGVRAQPILDDNALGVLRRWFLKAGRQNRHGVEFERRGASAVARALTNAGYPTDKDDVAYAGRSKMPLVAHCVALVPETLALLRLIVDLHPGFDWRYAFRRSDHAAVQQALAAAPESCV
jgi:hypothetical protein